MGIVKKEERMENNLLMVLSNIGTSITALLSTLWGHFVILIMFVLGYFSSIAGLVHVVLALVVIDLIMGISVSVKINGKGSILSSKLRNTVFKLFFYLLFLIFTFLVEFQITGIECITPKIVFAVMAGVELWSIASNALILSPNMPFLRIFKKYLAQEISKKLDMTSGEVENFLNYKTDDEKKEDEESNEGLI